MLKKRKPGYEDAPTLPEEEDLDDEDLDEEEEDEEPQKKKPETNIAKKIEAVLYNHEQRINNLEAALTRIRGAI